MQKTYYYTDELNDDFAGTQIESKTLPEGYEFVPKTKGWRIAHFFVYKMFVTPIIKLIKLFSGTKIKNKQVLKPYKKQGAFIYGNHTSYASDAFLPTEIAFPRSADIVVNPDAVSIKFVSGIVRSCGGIAVPSDLNGLKRFTADVEWTVQNKHWVAIYPEAHIWPYYTGIRPFGPAAFKYPAKIGAPVFAYTTVYKKRLFFKKPKKEVYVDGPFFADDSLSLKVRTQKLRDEVYSAMCERAKLNNCEYASYVKLTDPHIAQVLNDMQKNRKRSPFFPKKRREMRAFVEEMSARYSVTGDTDYSDDVQTADKRS
ncbi:MAG: hypothetical protein LUF82_00395 [Clostridia bacterium]|nr:hypothetical protein [Clostridia bacterium]